MCDLAPEDAGQKLEMDRGKCAHLVNKDGAEIADDVDDAKDEASLREHGEVGAAHVTIHREHVCHLVQIFPYLQPQPHPASVPFFPQTLSDSVLGLALARHPKSYLSVVTDPRADTGLCWHPQAPKAKAKAKDAEVEKSTALADSSHPPAL